LYSTEAKANNLYSTEAKANNLYSTEAKANNLYSTEAKANGSQMTCLHFTLPILKESNNYSSNASIESINSSPTFYASFVHSVWKAPGQPSHMYKSHTNPS